MAFDIKHLRQETRGDYVATERLYVDAEGNVVPSGSPAAVSLLVAAGRAIPNALARQYGLIGQPEESLGDDSDAENEEDDSSDDEEEEEPSSESQSEDEEDEEEEEEEEPSPKPKRQRRRSRDRK